MSGFFEYLEEFFCSIQFFQNFAIKPFLSIPLYSFISIEINFVNNGHYFLKEIGIGPINAIKRFVVSKVWLFKSLFMRIDSIVLK